MVQLFSYSNEVKDTQRTYKCIRINQITKFFEGILFWKQTLLLAETEKKITHCGSNLKILV